MSDSRYAILNRSVLAISGEEARTFLQGLISNDIEKARPDQAIYAALLTPQGKCLFDFFIIEQDKRSGGDGQLLLDVEAERATALTQRLTMYKLRAKVDIADVSGDFAVAALLGTSMLDDVELSDTIGAARGLDGGAVFVDPRLSALGARAILPKDTITASLEAAGLRSGDVEDYERMRFAAGVPEGSSELGVDKSPLLELGFEELQGVDFEKGCFVGQELTARMKYRGLVRKRLMPLAFDGEPPAAGTAIKAGSRDIGDLRSTGEYGGFAVLRLDKLKESTERGETLSADDVPVTAIKPDWVNF
ncbi:MAG: YgfZ/GcvT domain-containing protein [Geminicoccaceae bacterium]